MKTEKNRILVILLAVLLCSAACKKDDVATPAPAGTPKAKVDFTTKKVKLGTHKLATFSVIKNSKYLVIFEAGLGDDHTIWNNSDIALKTSDSMDVVTYDRASHGDSEKGPDPRDINRLQGELDSIIDAFASGRKIVLIGHSLGGFIIRDWAIKNPTRIAGLLFVDPSHEAYSHSTQEEEDAFYDFCVSTFGVNSGSTFESREWKEDLEYMATLGNLPDVPVIVLTATKVDSTTSIADRQAWYDAHELLGKGVSDFTHIKIPNSGHMVMIDTPQTLIDNILVLISKLP